MKRLSWELRHGPLTLAAALSSLRAMFRMPFELFLALRYLRPKRTFVSVITLISIVGVTLGVAVLIIVISVMSGFDRELRDKILGLNSHLQVMTTEKGMTNYEELAKRIGKHPAVKGVAPFIIGQVFLQTQPAVGQSQYVAPLVRGIDPRMEGGVSVLPKSVIEGTFDLKGHRILVGRVLADNMHLVPGDTVNLLSPKDLQKMKDSRTKEEAERILPEDYVVQGIFDVGYYEYNVSYIITSLGNAQDLFDMENSVKGLMVMLKEKDAGNIERIRSELGRELGPGIRIFTWMEGDNSEFLQALAVEKNVMTYILFFIMIVAAFGIMSALITFVVQKTREIGMLKALGAANGQIMCLFLGQSFMVGLIGVFTGYLAGIAAVTYRNEFLHFMRSFTGKELFPSKIYSFTQLPADRDPGDIAFICGCSLVICLLAGFLPAWNASRLKPVEALRS